MKLIVLFIPIILMLLTSCEQDSNKILNPNFEKQIVKALNLKFVNSDSLYLSPFTRIINDTIVGINWHMKEEDIEKDFYFIQSLKNPKNKKAFKSSLGYIQPSYINTLKDGCLYIGGPSFMTKVCTDGTGRKYFENEKLFYINQISLYENKVIVCSMDGISILDINTEKIIWKYRLPKLQTASFTGFKVGNKFVFEGGSFIGCIDLDKLSIVWKYQLKNSDKLVSVDSSAINTKSKISDQYNRSYYGTSISKSHDRFIYDARKVINSNTGKLLFQNKGLYHLETDGDVGYTAMVDSTAVYLDTNFKIKWRLKYAKVIGIYQDYVIAINKDDTCYLIINKYTGRLKQKILMYMKGSYNIDLWGDYVRINSTKIYK